MVAGKMTLIPKKLLKKDYIRMLIQTNPDLKVAQNTRLKTIKFLVEHETNISNIREENKYPEKYLRFFTFKGLKKIAKKYKLKRYSTLKKNDLINLIKTRKIVNKEDIEREKKEKEERKKANRKLGAKKAAETRAKRRTPEQQKKYEKKQRKKQVKRTNPSLSRYLVR